MGETAENQNHFNGQEWYKKHIQKQTRKALTERDAAFRAEHAHDSNEALLAIVRQRAKELGHAPRAIEVLGSGLISRRFGSWSKALTACGLSYPKGTKIPARTELYKEEYKHQQEIYRQEKEEKKNKDGKTVNSAKKKKIDSASREGS